MERDRRGWERAREGGWLEEGFVSRGTLPMFKRIKG